MHGNWFYMTGYGIFGHEVKATKRSPPDNLTRWIITQSKGFTRKGIEKISRSVRAYIYLVLTYQVQARSSIVGNSAPVVDAQQVFKSMFKALINEERDLPKIVILTVRHDLKMLTEKHNDDKLAIAFLVVGAGLIAYHFW